MKPILKLFFKRKNVLKIKIMNYWGELRRIKNKIFDLNSFIRFNFWLLFIDLVSKKEKIVHFGFGHHYKKLLNHSIPFRFG